MGSSIGRSCLDGRLCSSPSYAREMLAVGGAGGSKVLLLAFFYG